MVLKPFGPTDFKMLKQKIGAKRLHEFSEIHRCPERAEIGSRQLIVEFLGLNVDF